MTDSNTSFPFGAPIRLLYDPEEGNFLRGLAANAQLFSVRLAGFRLSKQLPDYRTLLELTFSASIELPEPSQFYYEDEHVLSVKVPMAVVLEVVPRSQEEAQGEPHSLWGEKFEISVSYAVDYQLPEDEPPGEILDKGFQVFARLNGRYNVWPYARSEFAHLLGSMGLNLMPLPVFRIEPRPKGDTPDESDDE